jgi:hypothetical protein
LPSSLSYVIIKPTTAVFIIVTVSDRHLLGWSWLMMQERDRGDTISYHATLQIHEIGGEYI